MKTLLIAAVTQNGVIGMNNELPWRLREDLRRFRSETRGHAVIMGRKTRESLGEHQLPDRFNIVVTSRYDPLLGDAVVPSIGQAIVTAHREGHEKAFIIGGAQIYKAALPICDGALITLVDAPHVEGDAFFNLESLSENLTLTNTEYFKCDRDNEYDMVFERWIR